MKVLHINSYFVGSSFYENIFSRQRKTMNIQVYVHRAKGEYKSFSNSNCIISAPFRKIHKLTFFYKHNLIYQDLKNKVDLSEFDVIHAHSLFNNGFVAYKANKSYGIPYIVAVRNTDINFFFKYAIHLRKIAIDILNHANRIVFLSSAYRDKLISEYIPIKYKDQIREKSVCLPNGIDDFWIENRSIHNKDENRLRVITVGKIEKNKNALTVCKSLERLKEKGYEVEYTLVGDVMDKKYYKKIMRFDFVNYNNSVPKEELINFYRKNDLFVLASIYETFGLVYAEAMSQGLPVIYTRGQGFDGQFVDGEIGYSVDAKNFEEIAENIEKAYMKYQSIIQANSEKATRYSWDTICMAYKQIYDDVINKERTRKELDEKANSYVR